MSNCVKHSSSSNLCAAASVILLSCIILMDSIPCKTYSSSVVHLTHDYEHYFFSSQSERCWLYANCCFQSYLLFCTTAHQSSFSKRMSYIAHDVKNKSLVIEPKELYSVNSTKILLHIFWMLSASIVTGEVYCCSNLRNLTFSVKENFSNRNFGFSIDQCSVDIQK